MERQSERICREHASSPQRQKGPQALVCRCFVCFGQIGILGHCRPPGQQGGHSAAGRADVGNINQIAVDIADIIAWLGEKMECGS